MRVAVLIAVSVVALCACARPVVATRVAAPALLPVAPFDDDPVSFLVPSRRFAPGAVTIVRVCVAPDGSILSTDVIESSGDVRFDTMALGWARMIRLRSATVNGPPVAPCGQVRVEIRAPSEPRVVRGSDSLLG
jgi:hypothetical protein